MLLDGLLLLLLSPEGDLLLSLDDALVLRDLDCGVCKGSLLPLWLCRVVLVPEEANPNRGIQAEASISLGPGYLSREFLFVEEDSELVCGALYLLLCLLLPKLQCPWPQSSETLEPELLESLTLSTPSLSLPWISSSLLWDKLG